MPTPAYAMDFIRRGMNSEQAKELEAQINGDVTPANDVRFMGIGFPAPLAKELDTQITAHTGNAARLRGLGVPPLLADKIASVITGAF